MSGHNLRDEGKRRGKESIPGDVWSPVAHEG